MLKRGFDNIDTYYEDGHEYIKSNQLKELMRAYPDYCNGDWVLWIIPELYYKWTVKEVKGTIEIITRDGSLIEKTIVTRTPHPNKQIYQVSMRVGRKRIFGIPLVFRSFSDLHQIKQINIYWTVFTGVMGSKDSKNYERLNLSNVKVAYNLTFEENEKYPSYRFFTVHSKDYICDAFDGGLPRDTYYEYLNEFDSVEQLANTISYASASDKSVSSVIKRSSVEIDVLPKNAKQVPVYADIVPFLTDVRLKDTVEWDMYYHKKTDTLKATYMADTIL